MSGVEEIILQRPILVFSFYNLNNVFYGMSHRGMMMLISWGTGRYILARKRDLHASLLRLVRFPMICKCYEFPLNRELRNIVLLILLNLLISAWNLKEPVRSPPVVCQSN
jgi:hypothetical protein